MQFENRKPYSIDTDLHHYPLQTIHHEALKNQVKTDPHSPAQYRAYVPLINLDTFHEAFQIKPGDGMYVAPEKRVKIW